MNTCTNCKGEGIVGVGAEPWLKQGPLSTCEVCTGTGKAAEPENVSAPVSAEPAQDPVDSEVSTQEAPVAQEPAAEPEVLG